MITLCRRKETSGKMGTSEARLNTLFFLALVYEPNLLRNGVKIKINWSTRFKSSKTIFLEGCVIRPKRMLIKNKMKGCQVGYVSRALCCTRIGYLASFILHRNTNEKELELECRAVICFENFSVQCFRFSSMYTWKIEPTHAFEEDSFLLKY